MFERIKGRPKVLFLIDGIGALLSAFLLGVVLVRLESIFGIPPSTLYVLAVIPLFFALFDFMSYQRSNETIAASLKGIAVLNILYCFLSISLAFYHIHTITFLGWTYILIEIFIVITLAIIEFNVAYKITIQKKGK